MVCGQATVHSRELPIVPRGTSRCPNVRLAHIERKAQGKTGDPTTHRLQ